MTGGAVDRPWWQSPRFVAFALVLTALPLLWPAVPPLTDVPGHMGRYRVLLGTDADTLGAWYQIHWRAIGYLGMDLLVRALGPLFGLEPTVKAAVIAMPVLTAAAMFWLSREVHGRVQPTVLFALPLAWHYAFQLGFLNYVLAMTLALNAFALWLMLGRLGRFRLRAALFVPIAWVIWFAHLFGWVALGALVFSAELVRARRDGRGWIAAAFRAGLACLPLALPFVMFLRWVPGDGKAGSDYWVSLPMKPGWLVSVLRDRWRPFDLASVMVLAFLLYRSMRLPRYTFAPELLAAAIIMLLLFLAMPFGSAYADMRLAPYVVMLFVLAIRADGIPAKEQRALALIGLAFLSIRTAAATVSTSIEWRGWSRHLEALDHLPRGSRVLALVGVTCEQPWRMTRVGHLPSMAIARRASFSNDQYDLGGTALLTVTAPGLRGFANDPSQVAVERPCPSSPEFRTVGQALAIFPRDRFDHVWLIAPRGLRPEMLAGLAPVWSNGDDLLLRVRGSRLPSTSAAR